MIFYNLTLDSDSTDTIVEAGMCVKRKDYKIFCSGKMFFYAGAIDNYDRGICSFSWHSEFSLVVICLIDTTLLTSIYEYGMIWRITSLWQKKENCADYAEN